MFIAPLSILCYNKYRGGFVKKCISIFLVLILLVLFNGCLLFDKQPTESAKTFYDKVNESKVLIDLVATDVCAVWKDANYDHSFSTKDVNDAIEKTKNEHSENIAKINELDKEIRDLFGKAKDEVKYSAEYELERVMTTYIEYKDSVLNANEALDSSGYIGVSLSKDSLDRALQDLFVEL